jgi:hypothetical protein
MRILIRYFSALYLKLLILAMKVNLFESKLASAVVAVLFAGVLALLFAFFSIHVIKEYSTSLFVIVPLFIGTTSSLIYGYKNPRSLRQCIQVAFISLGIVSLLILVFAIEGLICLIMASPIGAMFTWAGAMIGYSLQKRTPKAGGQNLFIYLPLLVAGVPSFMGIETILVGEPELIAIRTQIEINAPLQKVWQNVVAFPELSEPKEFFFKAGIAYPIRADIKGSGVGAVRYCRFNTGTFVEPVTIWEENKLLQFSVKEQPEPMQELSPYGHSDTPHLHEYFVSKKGQFLLTELPDGKILLEGITWYYHRIGPDFYWQWWSDYIIHSIHQRVLTHIKNVSENA